MTIIAAMHTADGAWIAADSLHSHYNAGYGEAAPKLFQFENQKLVWGWFGGSDQADVFEAEMMRYKELHTWDDLTYKFENVVSVLDRSAGGQRFGVVFAGCLDGEWGFRAFARWDLKADEPDTTAVFCGVNRLAASVGWKVTADMADPEERFRRVMQAVIDSSSYTLGTPLQLWRITEEQCEQIGASKPT